MQAMTANMQGLKAAADSGSFAISESGAQAYIKAIDSAQKELRNIDNDLALLRQRVKLGTSPDAEAISQYNQEGAVGGAGTTGIVPAVNQLRTALDEARQAMQKAVENYREVDDSAAGTYNRY
jgi:uncharacterized protein YukE